MDDHTRIGIATAIDIHDMPVTGRTMRRRIAAGLQQLLEAATTTDALNQARQVRKAAVHSGLYVRPERKYAGHIERRRRPTRSTPWRTS